MSDYDRMVATSVRASETGTISKYTPFLDFLRATGLLTYHVFQSHTPQLICSSEQDVSFLFNLLLYLHQREQRRTSCAIFTGLLKLAEINCVELRCCVSPSSIALKVNLRMVMKPE